MRGSCSGAGRGAGCARCRAAGAVVQPCGLVAGSPRLATDQGRCRRQWQRGLLLLPDTGQDHVSYYDPSAYVGCAQHAASALFAEARQDVRANEFPFYTGTQQAVTTTRLRRHLIGYRAMVDGVPVDGIALAIALHPRSRPFASGWSTTSSRRNSALRPPGMGHWIDCPTRRPSSALPTGARIEMLSGLPASWG